MEGIAEIRGRVQLTTHSDIDRELVRSEFVLTRARDNRQKERKDFIHQSPESRKKQHARNNRSGRSTGIVNAKSRKKTLDPWIIQLSL